MHVVANAPAMGRLQPHTSSGAVAVRTSLPDQNTTEQKFLPILASLDFLTWSLDIATYFGLVASKTQQQHRPQVTGHIRAYVVVILEPEHILLAR